jgi:hypothetical protein
MLDRSTRFLIVRLRNDSGVNMMSWFIVKPLF